MAQRTTSRTTTVEESDFDFNQVYNIKIQGPPLDIMINLCPRPPFIKDMKDIQNENSIFMIQSYIYHSLYEPIPINDRHRYVDKWDQNHVRMPCSDSYTNKNGEPKWPHICRALLNLKQKSDNKTATVEDIKRTIEHCNEYYYNIDCLEHLVNEIYTVEQRSYFLSAVLSNICSLAINVDIICSRPPPLLPAGSNRSVTMSQRQAASLLACAFFCLYPYRSDPKVKKEYQDYPTPNFSILYQRGSTHKIEKLQCILNYFQRITEYMPNGVVTYRRYTLSEQSIPKWSQSEKGLSPMHLTAQIRLEDIPNTLQVDFTEKYTGGSIFTSGCIQEEIRFVLYPEMLISLIVCEAMQENECIFFIGCERFSSYKGYGTTFAYAGNYIDNRPRDSWGHKWYHAVAIDAMRFRYPSARYDMKHIKQELLKAYAGFHSRAPTADHSFPIATGNWGCGASNNNRQVKAIIQLMAASEACRPLIYAAYEDTDLIDSFSTIYNYLIEQGATVSHLYKYLRRYSRARISTTLFSFILRTPVTDLD